MIRALGHDFVLGRNRDIRIGFAARGKESRTQPLS
jgi:hypothetical protein